MTTDKIDPLFADLVDQGDVEFATAGTKQTDPKYAKRKFTCESCGGTGLWRRGTKNRHGNEKCNTCHGKGFLVTSPEAREKARITARVKRHNDTVAARSQNKSHGDGFLFAWLTKISSWNTFAASLIEQHEEGKAWSDKQVEACRRMYAKMKAKEAERATNEVKIDLTPIKTMFQAAAGHGYKKPCYRAEGFILSLAPSHGVNAGHIYVKSEDDVYMGKLTPEMVFKPTRDANDDVKEALAIIAADPHGAAVRYGNRTGRCACCGRELTNDESITRGIGPICAERWGLWDVKTNATKEEAKTELNQLKKGLM